MSDRFDELLREAHGLPEHSPLKIAVLEEAIREADRLADEQRGYRARHDLVQAGTFSGFEDRALVAFSWCLAHADRLGDDFHGTYSLMWSYKWIARSVTDFPTVTREQIESMQEDLGRRFEQQGYDRRPILKILWSNALDMGDDDRAAEIFEEWRDTPRGFMSDCRACDENAIVHWHATFHRDEDCLRQAEPILAGRFSCASVPHTTYGHVLAPLARLDRLDEADVHQRTGYRLISRNRDYLSNVGDHLDLLTRTEKWDRALRMVERHLPWTLEATNPSARYGFDVSAWVLFERLVARGDRPRKFRTPVDFPLQSDDDRYRPSDLAAWFGDRVRTLADQFDQRNGNHDYRTRIASTFEFVGLEPPEFE